MNKNTNWDVDKVSSIIFCISLQAAGIFVVPLINGISISWSRSSVLLLYESKSMANFAVVPKEMTATLNLTSEIVILDTTSLMYCSCSWNISPVELKEVSTAKTSFVALVLHKSVRFLQYTSINYATYLKLLRNCIGKYNLPCSHSGPSQLSTQLQRNDPRVLTQDPLLLHGFKSHSSWSVKWIKQHRIVKSYYIY